MAVQVTERHRYRGHRNGREPRRREVECGRSYNRLTVAHRAVACHLTHEGARGAIHDEGAIVATRDCRRWRAALVLALSRCRSPLQASGSTCQDAVRAHCQRQQHKEGDSLEHVKPAQARGKDGARGKRRKTARKVVLVRVLLPDVSRLARRISGRGAGIPARADLKPVELDAACGFNGHIRAADLDRPEYG